MTGEASAADAGLVEQAEALAATLLVAARGLETRRERRRRRRVATLLDDEASREFVLGLTDQVLRIRDPARAARRLHDLTAGHTLPAVAAGVDRLALEAGVRAALVAPRAVMPLVLARLRRELAGVVLAAEPRAFDRHARHRRAEGIRLNVNVLGEAILGDDEATRRQEAILAQLRRPGVDYVSVKITAICAQLDVLAFDHSVDRIVEQLRPLYAEAARHHPSKFVNLDMEEHRDLHLTIAAFRRLLDERAFAALDAGIVLQAYLPDSHAALIELCEWARERHGRSGGVVKVRIVKGANLAMERVEAELRGWPQAPFTTKAEVDASYKRLLDVALAEENAGALRVGVASHNLFDVGWALAARRRAGAVERVELEMLEGMANPQARATARAAGGLLLYAPIVARHDFEAAVAYLVRRLDENTAPENFLRHLFDLTPGSPEWDEQRERFRAAVAGRRVPAPGPRRTQDRSTEPSRTRLDGPFVNEPDTDFSLTVNRDWIERALASASWPDVVPAVVDGREVTGPVTGVGIDPSASDGVLYRYVEADRQTVDRAVAVARAAAPHWARVDPAERSVVLHQVAAVMGSSRGTTLAAMAHDAGKTIGEGDPEVSEAIDLARYYGDAAPRLGPRFVPHGVVVVASPWNFPYAIPTGGVLAALAAGNAVILKPAPETVLTAWLLAGQCWEAGVPTDALQFLPCADDDVGRRLITHPGVDAVVLTGAWATARQFLHWRPSLRLHAETSGKNAIVITAAADLDDAIRDIVRSAFGHAGQKCSAASLAIVEASVHDDPRFQARLADAVRSLQVGPATDLATQVGPLIRPPEGALLRQLTTLDPGEHWLVSPSQVGDNPRSWRPGVKTGVRPGSQLHLTECFGPVLGVLRAEDLDHAIALQDQPPFGLTGGIHSLDDAEVRRWAAAVQVGNAYVNRHITGAVVQRQPFGGWKRSAVGPGVKAGGPSYVASLGSWPTQGRDLERELERARRHWSELVVGVDPTGLRAEQNLLRLRPLTRVVLRLGSAPKEAVVGFALAVGDLVGGASEVSGPALLPGLGRPMVVEDEATFVRRLGRGDGRRVRLLDGGARLAPVLLDAGFEVDTTPISGDGEVELLRWTREQAISDTRHRHGDLLPPRTW